MKVEWFATGCEEDVAGSCGEISAERSRLRAWVLEAAFCGVRRKPEGRAASTDLRNSSSSERVGQSLATLGTSPAHSRRLWRRMRVSARLARAHRISNAQRREPSSMRAVISWVDLSSNKLTAGRETKPVRWGVCRALKSKREPPLGNGGWMEAVELRARLFADGRAIGATVVFLVGASFIWFEVLSKA